jgi:phospholipase C
MRLPALLAVPLQCTLWLAMVAGFSSAVTAGAQASSKVASTPTTATPIKHVIIVIGENRSFDNLFATYQPPDKSQQVWNLLSQGIVTATGAPGSNFAAAAQHQASDTDVFLLDPPQTGSYPTLPQPNTGLGPLLLSPRLQFGIKSDPGLSASDQNLLRDGGILPQIDFSRDKRFPANLPNGPFPITHYIKYSDTMGDPMHRFFQMWQQIDCSPATMTRDNPSGCAHDLYPWVATTIGWGPLVDYMPPWPNFTDQSTWQGSVAMGFYNMAQGDVPYFASLANNYAISDNYHQFQLGGTGPNSITTGTADPLVYTNAKAKQATPPLLQVEDPNPFPGSNNWYLKEGFYLFDAGNQSNASYTNCSDPSQPAVTAITNYLAQLPYKPFRSGNCAPGAYYLMNNQYPAYNRDGTLRKDQSHTVGPSTVPTIADALSAAGISWKYYGDGFSKASGKLYSHHCDICNPFEYAKSIMTTNLKNNIQDVPNFFQDLENGTLPAVSFIKPDDLLDMHPGTSLPLLFEAFSRHIIDSVQAQNGIWEQTAIFITTDESGGLYDSGYIQPIDFFGDGPRIPMIVVSPYAKKGYVDHTYGDHASFLKFVEKNWGLKPLSARSRDNLPNPLSGVSPYVPGNSPAVGDLMSMFNF